MELAPSLPQLLVNVLALTATSAPTSPRGL